MCSGGGVIFLQWNQQPAHSPLKERERASAFSAPLPDNSLCGAVAANDFVFPSFAVLCTNSVVLVCTVDAGSATRTSNDAVLC